MYCVQYDDVREAEISGTGKLMEAPKIGMDKTTFRVFLRSTITGYEPEKVML